jgi:hypothetical protein
MFFEGIDFVEAGTNKDNLQSHKDGVLQPITIKKEKYPANSKEPILSYFIFFKDSPGDKEKANNTE